VNSGNVALRQSGVVGEEVWVLGVGVNARFDFEASVCSSASNLNLLLQVSSLPGYGVRRVCFQISEGSVRGTIRLSSR
jgi:hypothetical protein